MWCKKTSIDDMKYRCLCTLNFQTTLNIFCNILQALNVTLLFWYTIKIHPRSKSTRFIFLLIYFIYLFAFLLFIFHPFFTITVTPNPYPRSVSGFRIWLGGFWTRMDFERVPLFYISILNKVFFLVLLYLATFLEMLKSLLNNLNSRVQFFSNKLQTLYIVNF